MGRFVLIAGPNQSGKSLFAEKLIAQTEGERYYIATMHPFTEDNDRRIQKHRSQRAGLGFQTVEAYYQVGDAPVSPDSVVLLEDVANLLSNVVFEKQGSPEAVYDDICRLMERCRLLVAVTIADLAADDYTGETADYIRALNRLNSRLYDRAAAAVTMREQVAVWEKGSLYAVL